ncbi:general substrate transporter [Paraphaeosphaeria sporulosa]|uniref:General substrate transporter n=1 Tax=Paraphaeosphaeria sporulosa TaxID=1460663 RepID=A0A177CWW8_9PLEO|nr:general substrate transporter [Paraphaeosphaeria sporulosa]OAG11538.1 general substrate transporter [Paraphaeosphaeria sporulosa]
MSSPSRLSGQRLATVRIFGMVAPAFWLYGYNQSNLGGVVGFLDFTNHFPGLDAAHTEGTVKAHHATIQATVVAIYTIGCLIGALSTMSTANLLGRRLSLSLYAAIACIGLLLQASTFSLPQLIVGRIVTGLGVGGVNAIVPVWQSETTSPRNRGKNVIVLGTFVASGIALAAWINFALSFHQGSSLCWRLSLGMPLVFGIPLIFTPFLFPESPRWLVQVGRLDDAARVFGVIKGLGTDDDEVVAAVEQARLAVRDAKEKKTPFFKLLAQKRQRNGYRLFLAFFVNFAAQMTGANAVSYYGTTIFRESLGFAAHQASMLNACVLTWKIFAAVLAFVTIDRVGRRALLLASSSGMAFCMAMLAICVSQLAHSKAAGDVAVFFLFLFMAFFPLGFLAANFLYSAEISTQELRVHSSAVGVATHWLCNFIVAEITPICFAEIGYKTYIIFAVLGCFITPVIYFFFPETNGRTLDEIDQMFLQPKHWWSVTMYSKHFKGMDGAQVELYDGLEKETEERVEEI